MDEIRWLVAPVVDEAWHPHHSRGIMDLEINVQIDGDGCLDDHLLVPGTTAQVVDPCRAANSNVCLLRRSR